MSEVKEIERRKGSLEANRNFGIISCNDSSASGGKKYKFNSFH